MLQQNTAHNVAQPDCIPGSFITLFHEAEVNNWLQKESRG